MAAQVEILKLGANLGQSLEQTSTLTTQNEQLRGTVAQLADDQRIERLAGAMGLVMPPPGAVGYLTSRRGGDVSGALANVHTPDSAAFVAMAPHNGALVTGPGASTLPPPAGTPPPPAVTTSTSTTTPSALTAPTSGATAASATTQAATTATTTPATAAPAPSPTPVTAAPAASTPPASVSPSRTTPTTSQASAAPATGAAAIQPSGTSQPSGGG